jgi:hypothetical protein
MQLRCAALTACLLLASTRVARADGTTQHVAAETAAYSDTDHVAVLTPSLRGRVEDPTAGWSVDGSYLVDVISAASVDIVSTASRRWTEVRHAGSVGGAYKPGELGGSARASISSEPDYLAYAFGGTLTRDFDDKNLVAIVGYGYGHDTIGRVGTPFAVFSRDLEHHALSGGLTALVDRSTVFALAADMTLERGDPSKPYRYIPLFRPDVAPSIPAGASLQLVTRLRVPERVLEQLPLSRDRIALTARLNHRFARATARLEARLYDDSWSIKAVSSDGRYLADVARRWSLGPHVRYHVQSAASFWRLAYESRDGGDLPALRTGNRELGPLLSVTAGGSVRWAIGPAHAIDAWVLGAHVDTTYTAFFDDLYITRRVATVGVLTAEASF